MNPQPDETTDLVSAIFGRSLKKGDGSAFNFLSRIPLSKVAIWGSFLYLLFLLQDFFGVIIGSFILSYIGASIVRRYQAQAYDRRAIVIGYFAAIVSLIVGFGLWVIPRAYAEGRDFIGEIKKAGVYESIYKSINTAIGPGLAEQLEGWLDKKAEPSEGHQPSRRVQVTIRHGDEEYTFALPEKGSAEHAPEPEVGADLKEKREKREKKSTEDEAKSKAKRMGKALQQKLEPYVSVAIQGISKFLGTFTKAILQTIISLIISFMIVWDLPRITEGLKNLEHSRLGGAYAEVAPSLVSFGQLVGVGFQAQTIIALVNTAFTSIGLLILDVPGIGFLALIVFICSFIPVVGMFLSTIPMSLVGLGAHGVATALGVVVMVIIVHAIEAYILNPQIYSAQLNLHPLLVLIVLVVAEHTVGMWGLIIAVPSTVYIYRHVILDADRAERIATTVDLTG